MASDWINGNKSILNNPALSGIVIGMTLNTKPEDIYRALMETTAFGARKIIENFEENGVPVNKIILCGGISQKNTFMMQMYADVLGRNIYVRNAEQAAALGSAVYAASAAGVNGGYAGILKTVGAMTQSEEIVYMPDRNESEIYEKLYRNYLKLHDLFGYGKLDVMEDLRKIRNSVREMELAR